MKGICSFATSNDKGKIKVLVAAFATLALMDIVHLVDFFVA